jgi:flagellar hook assembly protein FlgD
MRLDSGQGLSATWGLESVGLGDPHPVMTPSELSLRVSPTPFRSSVAIELEVPGTGSVTVDVLDINGRIVKRIHDGIMERGRHALSWDGRTIGGGPAPAGIYFAIARGQHRITAQKIVRIAP